MQTPAFLVWSIECACPLREVVPPEQPEKVERHLRAARAFSDACRENRIFEGLAVEGSLGFRVDESLAVYGGAATAKTACRACHANAGADASPEMLAGCFGMLSLGSGGELLAAFESAVEAAGLASAFDSAFAPTQPRWFGVWSNSPVLPSQAGLINQAISALLAENCNLDVEVERLRLAAQACQRHGLRLFGQMYPPGEVRGHWWHVAPHCRRCRGERDVADARCGVCGCVGEIEPARKRRARGRRPYFPLDRLLGPIGAAAFLERYRESWLSTN